MIDLHIHTSLCHHATGEMKEYVSKAKEKKIQVMGFADHFPLDVLECRPLEPVTMNSIELPNYVDNVLRLAGENPDLEIKLGVEVDYIPGTEEIVARELKKYPFDYVIGSVHFMGDWDFTHPAYAADYESKNIYKVYFEYYQLIQKAAKSGLFDIIGHVDVRKKFGYIPQENMESLIKETIKIIKDNKLSVEINMSGERAPVKEPYPSKRFLELCYQAKVPVTMGSDAHNPDDVARGLEKALDLLKGIGYDKIVYYNNRQVINVAI